MRPDDETSGRRWFLRFAASGGIISLAGCSGEPTEQQSSSEGGQTEETEQTPLSLDTVSFEFQYAAEKRQLSIEYTGGARLKGGNIQLQTESGRQVTWAELGSTVVNPNDRLEAGATAVIGETIINWGRPITSGELVRLVYTGQETPATLGRYTAPTTTTVTTEVGTQTPTPTETPTESPTPTPTQTPTPTPTETPTPTPTETPTPTPTETPTPTPTETPTPTPTPTPRDETPPSINSWGLSFSTERQITWFFTSNERISEIEVEISGPETATLTTDGHTETERNNGTYRYDATYDASVDGKFTATLQQATDGSGNDGATGQSVDVSVITTSTIQATNENLAIEPPEGGNAQYLGEVSYDGTTLTPSVGGTPRLPSGSEFTFDERNQLERVETGNVSGYRATSDLSANNRTLELVSSVIIDNNRDSGLASLEFTNTSDETIELNTPRSYIGQEMGLVRLRFTSQQRGSGDEYRFYVSEGTRRSFSDVRRWETYGISGSPPFVMTSNDEYAMAVGVYDGPVDMNLAMTEGDPVTTIRIFTNRVVLEPDQTVEWQMGYTGLGTGNLPADEAQTRLSEAESLSIPDDSEWVTFE